MDGENENQFHVSSKPMYLSKHMDEEEAKEEEKNRLHPTSTISLDT